MNIKQIKNNKLKTILQFSIPSIIAMLLQTVITITDGYFTGNYVGDNALAAINLGLPILYVYLGAGLCVGVGGSVISGRLLGAKKRQKASEVFSQTMVTAVVIGVILSLAVFVLFTPILGFLRADGELSGYFTDYYRIMLFTYPLMVLGTILGMFIRVNGKPQLCMLVSIVRFRRFVFDRAIGKEMILNGSSEFIGEMASAISMFAFNYVLMKYVGADGVAAFTILGFVVYGYSMVCIGFGQGISPIVSICWGAKEKETASKIRSITNRILLAIGTLTALSFFIAGKRYAEIFGCSNSIADMVATGFRIYAITFLAMGYDVTGSMYFTSCGDAKSSAIISSLRGIVLLLAFILIFPAIFGMNGVWMTSPCAETLTAIVTFVLIRRQVRKNKEEENGR